MSKQTRVVQADLEMQSKDRYHQVPFEVPIGAESVGVRISFDRLSAVVDLGCEGPGGWRGWSGGARDEFVISASAATPGYVAGTLEPGTWAVILGLHNLPRGSVDVRVEVTIPSEVPLPTSTAVDPPAPTRRGSSRDLPAPRGLTWYAGDFHNHTNHSDGTESISSLARLGVEMGLDFLAVTDHNTVSHHPHLHAVGQKMGINLIPGQEVTTHRGHANAFGDIGWIDFREHPDRWIEQTEQRGGLISLNHPIDMDCAWVEPLSLVPHAVELWHASWYRDLLGDGILSWMAAWGKPMILLGGSDFHNEGIPNRPGTPVTWVAATDNTPEAIIDGVRAGRSTITGAVDYDGERLTPRLFDAPILLRQDGEAMRVLDGAGTSLVDFAGKRTLVTTDDQTFPAPSELGPYCLVRPDRTILALCN